MERSPGSSTGTVLFGLGPGLTTNTTVRSHLHARTQRTFGLATIYGLILYCTEESMRGNKC